MIIMNVVSEEGLAYSLIKFLSITFRMTWSLIPTEVCVLGGGEILGTIYPSVFEKYQSLFSFCESKMKNGK